MLSADIEFDATQAALTVNFVTSTGTVTTVGQANGSGKAKATLVGVQSGPQYIQVLVSPTAGSMTTNGDYKLNITLM